MAKQKNNPDLIKTSVSPSLNVLLLHTGNFETQVIQETLNKIKNQTKGVDTIKLFTDNDQLADALPSQSLRNGEEMDLAFLQKNLLVIDLNATNWESDLEHWNRYKLTGDPQHPVIINYVSRKGSVDRSTATTFFPKGYFKWAKEAKKQNVAKFLANINENLSRSGLTKKSWIIPAETVAIPSLSLKEKINNRLLSEIKTPRNLLRIPGLDLTTKLQLVYRLVYIGLLALGLLYALVGAMNVGISSDESRYLGQAEKVYRFYATLGADTSSMVKSGIDPQYFNGQVFDNALYAFGKPFGLERNFTFRHLINALTGWFSILFASLIALRLGGYRLALFTTLLMVLTPIYMGNVFNNHRDIPLSTFTVFGVYAILRYWDHYPLVSRKYTMYVILALALSFASRLAGGVLLGAFMALYSMMHLVKNKSIPKLIKLDKAAWRPALFLVGAVIIAFVLSLLVWPYGLVSPIKHCLEVIKSSGNHPVALYQIFESNYRLSSSMPDYYVIKYVLITIPVAVWIGVALIGYFYFTRKMIVEKYLVFFFLFCFLFPLIYSYLKLGNMYGSWRHFLFIFPFIAICSAIGWDSLTRSNPSLNHSYWSMGMVLILLLHPLQYVLRNHPFEYLYYNEAIGGTGGAYGKYEWDYSLNSLKQGSSWLKEYIREHHSKGTKLVIASNGGVETAEYFKGFDDSVSTGYTRYYERGTTDWDYAIFPNMYIHPYQLKNNIFPKGDSLYTLKIDGKPLCFIYKRRNRDDLAAMRAITANDANAAIQKLTSFLKYNPRSEWGWFQLAYIYAQNGNWSQAQVYNTESAKHHPEFMPNQALKGLIYVNTGKPNDAKPIFAKLIEEKYDLANSYKWSGMVYENEKNYKKALEQYGFALGAGNKQKDLYQRIAKCFRLLGDNTQAAKYEAMVQ